MALYFERYSMKEKLWEYAELSAKKKALKIYFKDINLNKKLLSILESGDLNNIIDIGKIVDEILIELE